MITKSEGRRQMDELRPSNFITHPYDSILQHSESEIVARNIMIILKRTGDTFRVLLWDEYVAERVKDGKFTGAEKYEFDQVISYCTSAEKAIRFSPAWAKAICDAGGEG